MSCQTCKCDNTLSNTGTGCAPLFQEARKLIVVPTFDGSGVKNKINLSTALLNKAEFDALVNHSDKTKRWYPLPEFVRVEDVRDDDVHNEDGDFVADGKRNWKGIVKNKKYGNPTLMKKLNALRCVEASVFLIDREGNMRGIGDGTDLYPIRLSEGSFATKLIPAKKDEVELLEIKFQFHEDEKDENLAMITCNEFEYDVRLLNGLIDVFVSYSDKTGTGFTAKLYTEYGTTLNPVIVTGITSFVVENITVPGVLSNIMSEQPDGYYKFSVLDPDPAAGNLVRITPSKDGYDFTAVINNPVTMV